jgi:hypothetical protein
VVRTGSARARPRPGRIPAPLPYVRGRVESLRRWQREAEIRRDLRRTRREVAPWGIEGSERADPGRRFGIVSFTNVPIHAKLQGLVGKAMQLRGYTPVVFTWQAARYAHEYFRLFGIDRTVPWRQEAARVVPDPMMVEAEARALMPESPSASDVLGATFHGVHVGRHALSTTARKLVQGHFDPADPATMAVLREQMAQAVQSVLVAERLLEETPLEKLLVRDPGYIPNAALFEVALRAGVDCVTYEQGQRRGTWVLRRFTPESLSSHSFSLAPPTWDLVRSEPWTSHDDALVEELFEARYRPGSSEDTRRLMTGKLEKPPQQVRAQLGLDPGKKTAVVFSHIAWDAAFFWGSCLFDDYEDWLFQTVRFVAAECPEVNWVVKLHPFNVFKLLREGRREESEMVLLRSLMPLPEHVRIMPSGTDISTKSLFAVTDYAVTVHGTVGLEFPAQGILAVLAGTGRFDGHGFTIDAGSRQEYFDILKNLHRVGPLSEEARTLARRYFLALFRRREYSLEDVAPMELKRLHEGQSQVHDNIRFTPRALPEFEGASSIKRLSDWLADSSDPDLMDEG